MIKTLIVTYTGFANDELEQDLRNVIATKHGYQHLSSLYLPIEDVWEVTFGKAEGN